MRKVIMKISKNTSVALITVAGLTASGAVVAPSAAFADKGHKPSHTATKVGMTAAAKELKTAVAAARIVYRAAVSKARADYRAATLDDVAKLKADLAAAKTKREVVLARNTYAVNTLPEADARDAAIEAAYVAYMGSLDAALAKYDAATFTGEALAARTAYRAAMKAAASTWHASVKTARTNLRTQVGAARDAYLTATAGSPTAEAEMNAWKAFVSARKAAVKTHHIAVRTAKRTYTTAVRKARMDFRTATGMNANAKLPGWAK
jgi:hypothetical protein